MSAWDDADRAYANAAFIPGAEAMPARWRRQAAAFRAAAQGALPDLPYGPGARQQLDLFLPEGAPQGTVVFIHGGYWLDFGRKDWSHLAAGPLARGWAVAMPSYTLAPQARIGEMAREVAAAIRLVAARVGGPVIATGHSAGGQLAARMGCADIGAPVARVLPVSPLAELAPLMATAMNARLRLDAGECARESPARLALRKDVSAHVWAGGDERPAFLWQARLLSEAWACPWTVEPGRHHFDVIDGFADAGSAMVAALLGPLAQGRGCAGGHC